MSRRGSAVKTEAAMIVGHGWLGICGLYRVVTKIGKVYNLVEVRKING